MSPVQFEDYVCIRVRPELRATQVLETTDMMPALTLYLDEKYDLGSTKIPQDCVRVSFGECLRRIATSNARLLDVPEPLWMRFAPKNILLMAVWKSSGVVLSKRREIVTYAIENNTIENLLLPSRKIPKAFVRLFMFLYGLTIYTLIDRIAFGSLAAQRLYSSLGFVEKVESILIEELPIPNLGAAQVSDRIEGRQALFVGALDDRKGILDLMAAWGDVESIVKDARIKIIGDGKHSAVVSEWCLERPRNRCYLGFIQHTEVGAQMIAGDVLVAPSRRDGRWREQIGLPIAEALSLGLTVVTTDETGLAQWLADNGHQVIPEASVSTALASSVVHALQQTLPPSSVINSLPPVAGRIAADHWLHFGHGDTNTSGKDPK